MRQPGRPPIRAARPPRVTARRAVVLAAGAWTGRLVAASGLASGQGSDPTLAARPGSPAAAWADAFQPRRGHLLELARPAGMAPLTCGLMEAAYAKARARSQELRHHAAHSSTRVPMRRMSLARAG